MMSGSDLHELGRGYTGVKAGRGREGGEGVYHIEMPFKKSPLSIYKYIYKCGSNSKITGRKWLRMLGIFEVLKSIIIWH